MAEELKDRPFTPTAELKPDVEFNQGIIMRQVPNPGSREALFLGCTCPPEPNLNGRGAFHIRPDGGINYIIDPQGKPLFFLDRLCPLHGAEAPGWFLQQS